MPAAPLLDVRDLGVGFRHRSGIIDVVRDLSFSVAAGETLAIVGESGSGKSVTALSVMRLIEREGGRILKGQIRFRQVGDQVIDLVQLSERKMRALRGEAISMIFQEPMTSLNPVLTIGDQIAETILEHRSMPLTRANAIAIELLERMRLSDPDRRARQYPHELSGGMRQRVMIAIALACEPKVLIADEPTTALDVTVQAEILDLIKSLQKETGMAVIFITHDMGVVAEIADNVVVMHEGRRVEAGPVGRVFKAPQADYTRALLAAVPRIGSGAQRPPLPAKEALALENEPLLAVDRLSVRFPVRKGPLRRIVAEVHAVDDVSFSLQRGETLGLVGESGSGKSTISRAILRLIDPTSGRIHLSGRDITRLSRAAMRPLRRDMQMIFQDPFASLNPRMTIEEIVTEPLLIHTRLTAYERRERAAELLCRVRLPVNSLDRYPHQFSGGQRQRICIARALSCRPRLIVADEPVSALDVSVQGEVLELMRELQADLGLACLFISHDLAVVEQMSHRVVVLQQGRIVEMGPTEVVLREPMHAYTRALLSAVPVADPTLRGRQRLSVPRSLASPIRPVGFVPEPINYVEHGDGHLVAA
jgi:peptide/nickel transport system ATP-binding protein/glutathione transport system ATP-binding protein